MYQILYVILVTTLVLAFVCIIAAVLYFFLVLFKVRRTKPVIGISIIAFPITFFTVFYSLFIIFSILTAPYLDDESIPGVYVLVEETEQEIEIIEKNGKPCYLYVTKDDKEVYFNNPYYDVIQDGWWQFPEDFNPSLLEFHTEELYFDAELNGKHLHLSYGGTGQYIDNQNIYYLKISPNKKLGKVF